MMLACSGLNGSHAMIKFFPAHNIDHPLEWMVKEKFMESVKYIDHKEKGGSALPQSHQNSWCTPLTNSGRELGWTVAQAYLMRLRV